MSSGPTGGADHAAEALPRPEVAVGAPVDDRGDAILVAGHDQPLAGVVGCGPQLPRQAGRLDITDAGLQMRLEFVAVHT